MNSKLVDIRQIVEKYKNLTKDTKSSITLDEVRSVLQKIVDTINKTGQGPKTTDFNKREIYVVKKLVDLGLVDVKKPNGMGKVLVDDVRDKSYFYEVSETADEYLANFKDHVRSNLDVRTVAQQVLADSEDIDSWLKKVKRDSLLSDLTAFNAIVSELVKLNLISKSSSYGSLQWRNFANRYEVGK